jgi:hypothetical protein
VVAAKTATNLVMFSPKNGFLGSTLGRNLRHHKLTSL